MRVATEELFSVMQSCSCLIAFSLGLGLILLVLVLVWVLTFWSCFHHWREVNNFSVC